MTGEDPAIETLLEISRLQREALACIDAKPNPNEGDPDRDPAAWRQYVRQLGANFDD